MNLRIELFVIISILTSLAFFPTKSFSQDSFRIPHTLYDQYFGTYQFGENHFIIGGPTDEFEGNYLIFRDYLTQKTIGGFFKPVSKTEFVLRNSNRTKIRFKVNDKEEIRGMWWIEKSKEPQYAPKVVSQTIEQIHFENGDVTLKGELFLPESKGPHPVIVLIHGSGKATRHAGPWNAFFIKYGIGVLTYDKRGSGASTGNFSTAGYKEFASDAEAAVEFLKNQPNIDSSQIGLHGSSEGGWVAPITATRSDVSFMIIRVGSGLSARETYIHEFRNELANEPITDKQQIDAIKFMRDLQQLAKNKKPRAQADSLIQRARTEKWFSEVFGDWNRMSKNEWVRMQKAAQVDPTVYLKKLGNIPIIYFLAENDENIPTQKSIPKIKDALQKAGNDNFEVVVLPGANHAFHVEDPNNPDDKKYSLGYWDKMALWLNNNVTISNYKE